MVCGVNSAVDKVQKGENQNCRFYDIEQMKCVLHCVLFRVYECCLTHDFCSVNVNEG